ncbi:hypothetical protein GCM10028802_04330 [Terrabacter terrigena]
MLARHQASIEAISSAVGAGRVAFVGGLVWLGWLVWVTACASRGERRERNVRPVEPHGPDTALARDRRLRPGRAAYDPGG